MLSDADIQAAIDRAPYSADRLHEHPDCVRLAYEWLDAQTKTKAPNRRFRPLKHIIEHWAGRYVSASDVEVAAAMHPDIIGRYPYYNISQRMVQPNPRRFAGIGQAMAHGHYNERMKEDGYATSEP